MATTKQMPQVLIDSDVLIWLTRGNARASEAIEKAGEWFISAVSYMELAQGCRNKAELRAMQKTFKAGENEVFPITEDISGLACTLVETYSLSHSLHMADALIAATALTHGMPLLTGNGKHFAAVDGLKLKIFKP